MPYFDHNASSPILESARKVWLEAQERYWHNPSALYKDAAAARRQLDDARAELAELLGTDAANIVFTSGATESNHALIASMSRTITKKPALISQVEHPSVTEPAKRYFKGRLDYLPSSDGSSPSIETIDSHLKAQNHCLVSVMAVNNETGIVHDWEAITECCQMHKVPYHCDASQWIGKLPASGLGACDFVTGSAHKWGGPKGVGFIKINPSVLTFESFIGGAQEKGMRSGTEDIPSILAMLAALKECESLRAKGVPLRGKSNFEARSKEQIEGARVVGEAYTRIWNTSMIVLPQMRNTRWVSLLDKAGFQVSTGAACHSNNASASNMLRAIGLSESMASSSIRISSTWATSEDDWDALFEQILELSNSSSLNKPSNVIKLDY